MEGSRKGTDVIVDMKKFDLIRKATGLVALVKIKMKIQNAVLIIQAFGIKNAQIVDAIIKLVTAITAAEVVILND